MNEPPVATLREGVGIAAPRMLPALSIMEREQLGERAKQRRMALGLSRKALASRLDIGAASLIQWEACLPRTVKRCEMLWEEMLRVPPGWLRDTSQLRPAPASLERPAEISIPEATTVSEEIRSIACCLARRSLCDRCPDFADLTASERRRAEMFSLRYGVAGRDLSVLEAIGIRYGVTRERIRAITAEMIARAAKLRVSTPRLDQLALEVQHFLPASVSELDSRLRKSLGEFLPVQLADRFAREVLGKRIVNLIEQPGRSTGRRAVIAVTQHEEAMETIAAVRMIVTGAVRGCGAAHIAAVARAASDLLGREMLVGEVLRYCRLVEHFEWLSEEDGWFWLGAVSENPIVSFVASAVMAGQRDVSLEEVEAAVRCASSAQHDSGHRCEIEAFRTIVIETALSRIAWLEIARADGVSPVGRKHLRQLLAGVEKATYCMLSPDPENSGRYDVRRTLLDSREVQLIAERFSDEGMTVVLQMRRNVFMVRDWHLVPGSPAIGLSSTGGEFDADCLRRERVPFRR